jgi:hypothetical protein
MESERQREALRVLRESEATAAKFANYGLGIVESMTNANDFARVTRQKLSLAIKAGIADDDSCERLIRQWGRWIDSTKQIDKPALLQRIKAMTDTTSNTATTIVSIFEFPPSFPDMSAVEAVNQELDSILARAPLEAKARESIARLEIGGLRGDNKSITEMLDVAMAGIRCPTVEGGDGGAILLPVRTFGEAVYGELKRALPKDFSQPYLALREHFGRDGLADEDFSEFEETDLELRKLFGSAKQRKLRRPEQDSIFHRQLLSVNALMSSIDEYKFCPAYRQRTT